MNFWAKNFLPFSDLVFAFYGKNQLNQIKLLSQKIKAKFKTRWFNFYAMGKKP